MSIIKDREVFIVLLLLISTVFFMNIGYAKMPDEMSFSGVHSRFRQFDIQFSNPQIVNAIGVNQSQTFIKNSSDCKDLFLNVAQLQYPGASVEFAVDVVNNGTTPAKIQSLRANGFTDESAIKFKMLNLASFQNKTLQPGEKVNISFMIEWDKDCNITSEEKINFDIQINCEQAV